MLTGFSFANTMVLIFAAIVSIVLFCVICYRRLTPCKFLVLNNKVIFITGCDSGIGRRLALLFAGKGCVVFAGCLRPDEAFPADSDVRPLLLDITDSESVQSAVVQIKEFLQETKSELWCLINNAGVCTCGEFDWLTMEQCCRLVQVNLLGTIRVTKTVLPLLRSSRGRLITITSVNGFVAYPGLSVYSATKFALEGLHDSLRIELRSSGVSVSLVQPGDLARLTNIMAGHQADASRMWDQMSEEDRTQYGSYFKRYHESVLRNYGLSSPLKFEDSPLPRVVEHAAFSERPKARYLAAPLAYRVGYKLLAGLPTSIRDYLLEKISRSVLNR